MTATERQIVSIALADAEKWAAIVARDKARDGLFFYSVSTTGVYCRPSCPSRRAKRENIAFHDSCQDAEAAGFRPCKRCKPRDPTPQQKQADAVMQACRIIQNSEDMPKLQELAAAIGLSPHHFHRQFRAAVGMTPKAYASAHQNQRLRTHLARGGTVTEAIHAAGLNATGHLYAASKKTLGMTPKAFQKGGIKETIRFALGTCWIGAFLVAQSQKGICAILLGDDPEQLLRDLQDQFPKATLVGGDKAYETVIAKVVGLIDQPASGLDLPLDIRGTAFQHRVWQALRRIPPGTTKTYADIARDIGQPDAVRAVAGACAANKVAVAIPCHRVIRTDGTLSGYRWGVERKQELLQHESAASGVRGSHKR